ncbi:MAG: permease [Longimicrobiales bacterium]|nr:permease [Longimicrobiales bacterium]
MIWLLASLTALVVGPLLLAVFGARRGLTSLLDGFIVVAVPGLIFLHFVPEALEHLSLLPIVALVLGFWAPLGAEKLLRDPEGRTDQLALALGVTGMALHGLLDGAALPSVSGAGDASFALAVVLHRVPVGLAVWWMVRSIFGAPQAVLALAGLGVVTVVGWVGGAELSALVGSGGVELYQAFVGGSLVHVIFHRSPELAPDAPPGSPRRTREGTGAILAFALLVVVALSEGAGGAHSGLEFLHRLRVLAAISAPALVIAYLFAGLIFVFMPASSIRWMSRGGPASSAGRGMLVGLPLPVCSCGVVPLYQTLIRRGAAPTAAMAFLVATPELGLDAILLSFPLLGAEMTGIRVAAAALAALLVGWSVGAWVQRHGEAEAGNEACACDGCGLGVGGESPSDAITSGPERRTLESALRVGFGRVVDETAPWVFVGLGIAALAAPLLAGGGLARLPAGLDVLLFAALGFPTYVCASSATPLVAALMAGGLGPGAAVAFLITGPATNVTTLGVLSSLHGRAAAIRFATTLVTLAVGMGLTLDLLLAGVDLGIPSIATLTEETPGPIEEGALVVLLLLVAASVTRLGIRAFAGEVTKGLGIRHRHTHPPRDGNRPRHADSATPIDTA